MAASSVTVEIIREWCSACGAPREVVVDHRRQTVTHFLPARCLREGFCVAQMNVLLEPGSKTVAPAVYPIDNAAKRYGFLGDNEEHAEEFYRFVNGL